MGRILIAIPLALAGACMKYPETTAGQHAERQYAIVVRNGGNAQLRCTVASNAAGAYLDEENEPKYAEWHRRAAADCARAQLES